MHLLAEVSINKCIVEIERLCRSVLSVESVTYVAGLEELNPKNNDILTISVFKDESPDFHS